MNLLEQQTQLLQKQQPTNKVQQLNLMFHLQLTNCSFIKDNPKTNCKLSKLYLYTNGNSFNFATSSITNRYQTKNTKQNADYLIQSDGIKENEIKDLKSSTAKYIETNPQNNTSTTPLTIETAVFVKLNDNQTKLTELIINN